MNPVVVVCVLGAFAWPYRRIRRSARSRSFTVAPNVAHSPTRRAFRPRRSGGPAQVTAAMPDAIELVVLAVRAGALPATAVATVTPHVAPSIEPAFRAVQAALLDGQRFADAVQELPRLLGPAAVPLADSLAAADRDGLPLAPVLERLADEARTQRRRHADTMARQLPVRLSLPLVLCTLPSFVLLAIAPLLLAALSSLHR